MPGVRVLKNQKSLILEIPTKDRGILKYFTSVSGMKALVEGKRNFIYFNPRADFDDGK